MDAERTVSVRNYETVNSGSGGEITKSIVRYFGTEIEDTVGRKEPLTLQLEGSFIDVSGRKSTFTIQQHFDIVEEQGTKSARDVLSDQ